MHRHIFILGLIFLLILTTGLFSCAVQPDSAVVKANIIEDSSGALETAAQVTEITSIRDVVARVRPSVVAINIEVTSFDFFNRPVQQQGAGSGWVIRADGYIVTNAHVVEGADNIVVTTSDGNKYPAQDVFMDSFTDLAVIKIDATSLPVFTTGDSTAISVGDGVIAIGNALGQGISATSGIVSAKDVSLEAESGQSLDNLIQTDAAINPGNSGGPLVNMDGEVIGITSVKISLVGVEGMGYALGINQALPVINVLIEEGRVIRPYLGISIFTVDAQVAAFYNLAVDEGVLITSVVNSSPADDAGLRPGDVITAVDGNRQTDAGQLMNYLDMSQIGQQVEITFIRGLDTQTVTITLGESPS